MNVKQKLTVSYLAIFILATIVGAVAWRTNHQIIDKFQETVEVVANQQLALERVKTRALRAQLEITSFTALLETGDSVDSEEGEEAFLESEIGEFQESILEALAEIEILEKDSLGLDNDLKEVKLYVKEYQRLGNSILSLVEGQIEFSASPFTILEDLEDIEDVFIQKVENLQEQLNTKSEGLLKQSQSVASRGNNISIILIVLLSVFVILLGAYIIRFIGRELSKLRDVTQKYGQGNYDLRYEVTGKDEFNQLGLAFNQMAKDLDYSRLVEQHNASLQNLNNQLQTKNDALDSFVYRVSHDLKGPVVNIEGLVQVIKTKLDKPHEIVINSINFLDQSLQKLKRTIYDLLEVSRIERNLQEKIDTVLISEVIDEVVEEHHMQMLEVGFNLKRDLQVLNCSHFSKVNFKSIIANLVTNAIKYRSKDLEPQLVISSFEQDGWTHLRFRDNGVGINLEANGPKLFQMFARFNDQAEGSGVGLYIVHKIVTQVGGKVNVESKLGEGTCFEIVLPTQAELQD